MKTLNATRVALFVSILFLLGVIGPINAAVAQIQVVAGTYGQNCNAAYGNVTNHLAASCNGRPQCDYVIDYTVIGDPASGCQKNYVAEWRCGGNSTVHRVEASEEAGFGKKITLSCKEVGENMEFDTNRFGGDFANFDLPEPRPEICQAECAKNGGCMAWTYVKPGIQGPSARCWLKSTVPNPVPNTCCVSGLGSGGTPTTGGMEFDMNRWGADFVNFDLPQARPELCQTECAKDSRCMAWTYVKPGVQGPSARCWLKNGVPNAIPNSCCVSGVKQPR